MLVFECTLKKTSQPLNILPPRSRFCLRLHKKDSENILSKVQCASYKFLFGSLLVSVVRGDSPEVFLHFSGLLNTFCKGKNIHSICLVIDKLLMNLRLNLYWVRYHLWWFGKTNISNCLCPLKFEITAMKRVLRRWELEGNFRPANYGMVNVWDILVYLIKCTWIQTFFS